MKIAFQEPLQKMMTPSDQFAAIVQRQQHIFHPVVDFDPVLDKLMQLDFTESNHELTGELLEETESFTAYITGRLQEAGARYGIGGYGELRTVYSRSPVFNAVREGDEPRRLHLGIDIWGRAGDKVYAPMGGMVHSFAFNHHFGDYGATIILAHQLNGFSFYSLYGHLSLDDIENTREGNFINCGRQFAQFGEAHENGHWPPHLHFQLILDLELYEGDYPGVCRFSEKNKYLANCPDPDLILQMNKFLP